MAECYTIDESIIMEPTLLFTFGLLICLYAVVAIDEMLERRSTLGEEWDFLTPLNRRRS